MSADKEFILLLGKLDNIIEELRKILNIFKKNPKRKFCENYLEEKKKIVKSKRHDYGNTLKHILIKYKINHTLNDIVRKNRDRLAEIIKQIAEQIETREKELEKEDKEEEDYYIYRLFEEQERQIMADSYKYKEARALPELKTINSHWTIRDFLTAVKGYHDTLNNEGKIALIRFVAATKITGEARTKIGEITGVDSFTGLKLLLNTKGQGQDTQTTLLKKLSESQQEGKSVEGFAAEISEIVDRLVALEMSKLGLTEEQGQLVSKIYEAQAIGAFKKGLRRE
ncbi:MAG TPA: hypothetical protein DD806_07415, partial [Flavobacterium sp.]|nr:hypothetical protein [Flavobacterium sp.]